MIELGIAALVGLGVGGGALRWMHGAPAGTMRKALAVVILGRGGPGAPG